MSGFCSCDFDGPSMYVQSTRTARKAWVCIECDGPINPGDTYQRTVGVWEGSFDVYPTCTPCVEGPVAFVLKNCVCLAHGGLFLHLEDVFIDYDFEHPGVKFRVGRWRVEARRRARARRKATAA